MANNRLWLIHRPSGQTIFLGKRMAFGWYCPGHRINIQKFFETCEAQSTPLDQDDFVLAMEDASKAPDANSDFAYEHTKDGMKPCLLFKKT